MFWDSNLHTKAINNDSGYLMSQILGQCVGLLSGGAWQLVRRKMEQPFSRHSVINSAPVIRMETQRYMDGLLSSENIQNGRLDPARDIKLYPFLVTAAILYGRIDGLATWLKRLLPIREELFSYVVKGGLPRFSVSRYLPTRANRLLRAFQTDWLRFNEEICRSTNAMADKSPVASLWEDAAHGGIDQTHVIRSYLD